MADVTISRREQDGAVVLEIAGELDLAAEPVFRAEVEPALGAATVVLDLSGVSFMDSTGLRLLLESDARVRDAGGRCVVVRGNGSVHRLIEQGMLQSRLELIDQIADLA